MQFEFSADEQELADSCRQFALAELAPLDAQIDKTGEIPPDLRLKLAEAGYTARIVPPELGGLGGSVTDLCLQQEQLAYGSITAASSVMATNLCLVPIVLFGNDRQKEQFLPPIRDGGWVGTIAITEPTAGSDAAAMRTSAVRDGEEWVLNGSKRLIDNTSVAQLFMTWAKTDPEVRPAYRGISAFVVERDRPGFVVDKIYDVIGLRGLGVGAYTLRDCRVPAENLVGEEGKGWYYLMRMLEIGRTATAALCVGLAQAALDAAKAYALERRQFGSALADLQAIQLKIAEIAVRVDTARLLVYRAARATDAGKRADRESSMAKFWAADAAFYAANEAVQIFGGIGCTDEAPVERYLRDARIFSIGEGTGEIHRLVVARRELDLARGTPALDHLPDLPVLAGAPTP
jgi:alkylation response protein AidB-like acyl-CoA dehydrogenase